MKKNLLILLSFIITNASFASSKIDSIGTTPLIQLLSNESMDEDQMLKELIKLIKKGEDINKPSASGLTPLATAVAFGNDKAAKILLENKANPDVTVDTDNTTLLMNVIKDKNNSTALLLINHNAQLNLKDKNGRSAVFHAALASNQQILKHLIEVKKVNTEITDKTGLSLRSLLK